MMRQNIFENRKRQTPKMTFVFVLKRFFIMRLSVRLAPLGARQKNHPLCGCASKVIPKKLQTRYNKGVQANCKAKGENMAQKTHSVSHTKWMCSITLCSPLSIDEK